MTALGPEADLRQSFGWADKPLDPNGVDRLIAKVRVNVSSEIAKRVLRLREFGKHLPRSMKSGFFQAFQHVVAGLL